MFCTRNFPIQIHDRQVPHHASQVRWQRRQWDGWIGRGNCHSEEVGMRLPFPAKRGLQQGLCPALPPCSGHTNKWFWSHHRQLCPATKKAHQGWQASCAPRHTVSQPDALGQYMSIPILASIWTSHWEAFWNILKWFRPNGKIRMRTDDRWWQTIMNSQPQHLGLPWTATACRGQFARHAPGSHSGHPSQRKLSSQCSWSLAALGPVCWQHSAAIFPNPQPVAFLLLQQRSPSAAAPDEPSEPGSLAMILSCLVRLPTKHHCPLKKSFPAWAQSPPSPSQLPCVLRTPLPVFENQTCIHRSKHGQHGWRIRQIRTHSCDRATYCIYTISR